MKVGRYLLLGFAAAGFGVALTGCGGGGGSLGTRSTTSLTGTVTVPSGTPTRGVSFRATSTNVPLPGANVSLYDITQGGANALSGPPVATTTTDSNGNYQFQNLPAGHNFVVQASKTVTSTGTPTTITVATYASTNASSSNGPAVADADENTTLAVGYLLQQLKANLASNTANLGTLVSQFVQQVLAQEQAGHGPNIDLTKQLTDQENVAEQVEQEEAQAVIGGAYVGQPPSQAASDEENEGKAVHALVDLVVDTTHSTVQGVLVLADSGGHVSDADSFSATLQSDGSFTATTTDASYTVNGAVDGEEMHGHWASVNGQLDGHWEATHASAQSDSGGGSTPPPPPAGSGSSTGSQSGSQDNTNTLTGTPGAAYVGTFTAQATGSSSGPSGSWFLFLFPNKELLLYAHDNTDTTLPHNQKVVLAFGSLGSNNTLSLAPVFPLASGASASATISASAALGQPSLQGSWSCSGLVSGNVFNGSGTWTATLF
ncbi:carboxypeptidase-like regulatory domain-containing protein [Chthonomonas calidirosea]|uniref:carboxypeptidase-like regulatory domain-containing protein n=1 Tax=Chthonomonas calidirosea TaxID=454171 RepID=UPI0006ECA6E1|nr:carboxypeptidase-like regulatory domain-containing protein [Chthonomonas calidirosea]CEK17224.1 hypothetical protein CP488_01779 [Chthonomonas calidirosea]